MAFKDNLLQKIRIDQLAAQVLASMRPEGAESKLDKAAMRQLLSLSPFQPRRERDLDLYVLDAGAGETQVLVLDNELPIYRTTVADVAMRKSPDVAEMVKPRNIIKILRDSDVKISRKVDSLKRVQTDCIARLDLSFNAEDIDDLRRDGIASLESNYAEGVKETLTLFAELLGYLPPPRPFQIPHCTIYAAVYRSDSAEEKVGPAVIFNLMHNDLQLTEETFGSAKKEAVERFHALAAGKEKAAVRGAAVFEHLQRAVLSSRAQGN
ncbi:MAG TPA: hypothetical protein VN300_04400 [Desulfobacterales bacterium]|nr:hypothetical protein [Desulfobacterales bacterium]